MNSLKALKNNGFEGENTCTIETSNIGFPLIFPASIARHTFSNFFKLSNIFFLIESAAFEEFLVIVCLEIFGKIVCDDGISIYGRHFIFSITEFWPALIRK